MENTEFGIHSVDNFSAQLLMTMLSLLSNGVQMGKALQLVPMR